MPKERGHGEGSYRQRPDGTWEGRLTYNYRTYSRYGKTLPEVRKKIDQLKVDLSIGRMPGTKKIQYGPWLDTWLENIRLKNDLNTYKNYKSLIDNHIRPALGKTPVAKLTTRDFNDLLLKKKEKGVAPRTLTLIRYIIRASMKAAVKEQLRYDNPADDIPSIKVPKKVRVTLSPEAVNKLIERGDEIRAQERMFPALVFMAYTGVRRGELLGLRWDDVNLDLGVASINQALKRTPGREKKKEIGDTKTSAANRSMPLAPTLIRELKLHKARQDEEKKKKGYKDHGLVFCRADGFPYYPDSLRKILSRTFKAAGIPSLNPHGLRHTFATIMLMAGENPKVVQELMGHTNLSMTLGTYSHVIPSMKDKSVQTYDNFVSSPLTEK